MRIVEIGKLLFNISAMAGDSSTQRISRLTPLDAILALLARVEPVTPRACSLPSAYGRVLGADVVASKLPPQPIALRDGFAVPAGAVADASSYTPIPLMPAPPRVEAGAPMPAGTDAVLPLDTVTFNGERAEAIAAIAPGEGVLAAGGDVSPQTILRRAGAYLRASDIAVMTAAGIADVAVREPRLRIACGGAAKTPLVQAAVDMLTRAVAGGGGTVFETDSAPERVYEALAEARAHAGIIVGGSGSGRGDSSVRALAKFGRVEAHGIAVSPGETAALGFIDTRPVLVVPGRLDCALAIWLLIGRHIIAKLGAGHVDDTPRMLPLKRKVASTIGLTELVPVRYEQAGHEIVADPLASGYLSFEVLTGSDGWIAIPAESEGFAAGRRVAVRPWP
ncbi:MAG TPA: molybdopterin-binding protein [Xanthobacteraceae bacterium]|jgi:molybdopterin biosynthesis enzyme|nr:molybdopterin-binding protein [Xanthobacteraceae bacterium]